MVSMSDGNPKTIYVIQYRTPHGDWVDLEERTAEIDGRKEFDSYAKRFSKLKEYPIRLIQRTETMLAWNISKVDPVPDVEP